MPSRKAATKDRNGHRLEEALATLINNQALFVGQMAKTDARFGRIESELEEIKNILRNHEGLLVHHQQTLESLPEAIRQKIGFVKPR